ncbi:asparagine synthase C-terminal domain-containing protein [Cellvibrio polysaccharolyticus]|nr:asparagine synthase C-terminal domain-containing protein [Cellvibrio polysaccharolyticus]
MIYYEFEKNKLDPQASIPDNYLNVLYFSTNAQQSHNGEKVGIFVNEYLNEITIMSTIAGVLPIFWAWHEKKLLVSDSVEYLRAKIYGRERASPEDIDKIALLESILFDGPLAKRTLFNNIQKLQIGQKINFFLDRGEQQCDWFWLPKIQTSAAANINDDDTIALIDELMSDVELSNKEVLLPLTGGLDSRLLAGLISKKSPSKVHSYTFQRGASYESYCAKKVARELSFNHSIFNLGADCYRNFSMSSSQVSGGMITGMHTHGIYCCERLLSPELSALDRVFGYFGDPLTGAMTESYAEADLSNSPEKIFDKYKKTIFSDLVDRYKDEIIADLKESYFAFLTTDSPKNTYHEFWKIHQRQNNLITHLFSYHRAQHSVKVHTPFVNRKFADYFLSLPYELRSNRCYFKKIALNIFPDLFYIPSIHFPKKSSMARVESTFKFAEDFFNKLNPRQEFFMSPFVYEHHEKNLVNYMQGSIMDGAFVFSEIFESNTASIEFPVWKKSTPKEYYRLSALGSVVKI